MDFCEPEYKNKREEMHLFIFVWLSWDWGFSMDFLDFHFCKDSVTIHPLTWGLTKAHPLLPYKPESMQEKLFRAQLHVHSVFEA